MVKVYIIPESESQANEIIEFLLRRKHMLTIMVIENGIQSNIDPENQISRLNKTVITGIIRSLQFNKLNDLLREMYRHNMPMLYSIPVIHMDPKQSDAIVDYITVF